MEHRSVYHAASYRLQKFGVWEGVTAVQRCARTWCCCGRGRRWWRRGRADQHNARLVKSMGARLPQCSSRSFGHKVGDAIPEEVREALLPLAQLADGLS